ncbi:MAG: hypothetical protein C4523_12265 [Myxococcales bacterium]|nr:MAG: hypothetical protein C4523_12265 [Myxococcales bacterium]
MKRLTPDEIQKSRVYFTEFDRVTYSQVAWSADDVEQIKLSLERKLKLLALVKGHVVIAASHLIESELAREILLPHPRLFSDGLVIPALRSECDSLQKFVNSKVAEGKEADLYKGATQLEMAQMIDSHAQWVVSWDKQATVDLFKQRLLQDLSDRRSVLRLAAADEFIRWPEVIEKVQGLTNINRKDVYLIAHDSGNKRLWELLSNWADFIYYLSGAVAVRSEGVLPQENLLDFSLTDLAGGRTRLSETQVFFKLFVDLVKQATHTHFPVDVLDALAIEDALDLHEIAVGGRFIDKYNLILERTKEGLAIHDPERLVLLMEELAQFETELHREYEEAIQGELPLYRKEKQTRETHQMLSATASLMVPFYDLPKTVNELIVSGLNLAGRKEWAERLEKGIDGSLRAINRLIDRREMEAKPVLLDFVEKIKQRYAEKLV